MIVVKYWTVTARPHRHLLAEPRIHAAEIVIGSLFPICSGATGAERVEYIDSERVTEWFGFVVARNDVRRFQKGSRRKIENAQFHIPTPAPGVDASSGRANPPTPDFGWSLSCIPVQ